jgi:hypothetical protein
VLLAKLVHKRSCANLLKTQTKSYAYTINIFLAKKHILVVEKCGISPPLFFIEAAIVDSAAEPYVD